jgi:hypothetical protein
MGTSHVVATAFVLLAAAVAIYWFMVRPVLAQWAAFKPLYDKLDEVEATFWFRLGMWFKGLKGLLLSWLTIIAPLAAVSLQFFDVVDVTSLLPEPMRPYWPVFLSAVGFVFLQINKWTDTPQGSPVPEGPAVVEVPTVPGKPDVAIVTTGTDVIAKADIVKADSAIMAPATEPIKVAEVLDAVVAGTPVVVEAKKEGAV